MTNREVPWRWRCRRWIPLSRRPDSNISEENSGDQRFRGKCCMLPRVIVLDVNQQMKSRCDAFRAGHKIWYHFLSVFVVFACIYHWINSSVRHSCSARTSAMVCLGIRVTPSYCWDMYTRRLKEKCLRCVRVRAYECHVGADDHHEQRVQAAAYYQLAWDSRPGLPLGGEQTGKHHPRGIHPGSSPSEGLARSSPWAYQGIHARKCLSGTTQSPAPALWSARLVTSAALNHSGHDRYDMSQQ